jgi:hypothetical protein
MLFFIVIAVPVAVWLVSKKEVERWNLPAFSFTCPLFCRGFPSSLLLSCGCHSFSSFVIPVVVSLSNKPMAQVSKKYNVSKSTKKMKWEKKTLTCGPFFRNIHLLITFALQFATPVMWTLPVRTMASWYGTRQPVTRMMKEKILKGIKKLTLVPFSSCGYWVWSEEPWSIVYHCPVNIRYITRVK